MSAADIQKQFLNGSREIRGSGMADIGRIRFKSKQVNSQTSVTVEDFIEWKILQYKIHMKYSNQKCPELGRNINSNYTTAILKIYVNSTLSLPLL